MTFEKTSKTLEYLEREFAGQRQLVLSAAGQVDYKTKLDNTPVTEFDHAIEQKILTALRGAYPDTNFYGEESGYDQDLPEPAWLIDPIDGTSSFIKNDPSFTGMAVLIENDQATASLIFDYSTGDVFTAILGHGTYKNGQKLDLSSQPVAKEMPCKDWDLEALSKIMSNKKIKCTRAMSGAGYGFCAVADGKSAARAQIQAGGYIHDYATGTLIVTEAGGKIVPIEGSYNIRSKNFIVCHPDLEEFFVENIDSIRSLSQQRASHKKSDSQPR